MAAVSEAGQYQLKPVSPPDKNPSLSAWSYAQGRRDVKPIPPALLQANERCNVEIDQARALLAAGKTEEAIRHYRDAVAIEDGIAAKFGWNSSSADYELAKALTQAGRPDEAIAAYRKAFWWSEKRQDLESNGPPFTELGSDYALLLAKAGKYEEAKAMYYWVMRGWMLDGQREYFPLVIVFGPDPAMTVWENKPDKILSAIMMLRAMHTQTLQEWRERIEEVRKREPQWIAPFVFAHQKGDWDVSWITQAVPLAQDKDEKEWLAAYDVVLAAPRLEQQSEFRQVIRKLNKIACERRKNSAVLKQAKLDMERMHLRLAAP